MQQRSLLSFFLIFVVLLLSPTKTPSQNDPLVADCSGGSNYTARSTFATNLALLLANLTSSAPLASSYFATAIVSESSSTQAYGIAQCRPDASVSDCTSCLNRSASAAAARCPRSTSAAVRFDLCILRYSDQRFFSQLDMGLFSQYVNVQNASDTSAFNNRLDELMDEISSEAATGQAKFSAGVANYSDFGNIYGLVQCTRDLSNRDCGQCVDLAVGHLRSCCYGKIGGQAVTVSCAVRFETTPFFSLSVVPPPPSSMAGPPPPVAEGPDSGSSSTIGNGGKHSNTLKIALLIAIPVIVAVLLSAICIHFQRKTKFKRLVSGGNDQEIRAVDLLFDLGTLRAATNNFSDANKLGEGGFGPVYKGTLRSGEEIAVKMLKGGSSQGVIELRNEVLLLARLQHRNLVRLLGFCIEEQEKMIIYEYLPNTSLDKLLFDPSRCQQLDWGRRYKIIEGITRGLVYLHEDSRLRIIHRDLKASNILLDKDMNPKISDFGLAKLFGVEDTHGNTSRIAGTYGYMAPEYAMHGVFSTKSDIFSLGVLILEIVTGQRNTDFQGSGNTINLLSHVWQHWQDGRALQLKDQSLGDHCRPEEFLRCVHIGLLCVQEDPAERPNMATIVLLLGSHSVSLPSPSAPAFFIEGGIASESSVLMSNANLDQPDLDRSNKSRQRTRSISKNEVTISELDPR